MTRRGGSDDSDPRFFACVSASVNEWNVGAVEMILLKWLHQPSQNKNNESEAVSFEGIKMRDEFNENLIYILPEQTRPI